MNVLAIDTSNLVLGIALLDEEKIIGEYITNLKKNHSIRVMPAIQELLSSCDLNPADIDKIVVAKGPGSYTGVRIGVTVAKTMAWSLQVPLVGISSLACMAGAGRYFNGLISPLFDARRGQLYTGLYRYNDGMLENVLEDQNVLASDWAMKLKEFNQDILFIGNDTTIHHDILTQTLGKRAVMAEISENNPRPGELGQLGFHCAGEDVHAFVPNYIRLVEAEAKWLEAQKNNR
ncbi:tRNA (adenosine(37)-N6)-threonylcarbamoyltransferase complex dimerization subunit type 1 TsaB [Heyndrickxia acidicola]|uniref:tRNA (Adenosine(37)-N6)-threonylcarbamoyltransferase complex dimerization subunit type 1 TsaB n=1 Tax=Heyndrickxia acidicola TaxID=209389 RepID=A0ABU6MI06_9BACI|nr:tRNA (adenosine(37)-N6)-threonylcarbamoyltransferase complex dimerization subunit type 1 TsaB [Heyndrickxia acidicola]MED1202695.1 tRNA (adenosine(37)-N6)-threonylcarbamoyltransferase complex dimerization subunit type 1 TsaB [Heyndrickxia acidicola]